MKRALQIFFLISLAACRATGPGGGEQPDTYVIFNVCSNNNDSCRCRANKYKVDSTLGTHCGAIDSLKVSYDRNGKSWLCFTDSLGLTAENDMRFVTYNRFYFIKKGFPVASAMLDLRPESKKYVLQGSGCDIYVTPPATKKQLFYITVVMKQLPKKGVKLVPYKPSGN